MAFDASSATKGVVGMIVGILVAAIMVGALLPEAITFILDANTTAWGDAETALFDLLPLVFVLIPFVALVAWVIDAL